MGGYEGFGKGITGSLESGSQAGHGNHEVHGLVVDSLELGRFSGRGMVFQLLNRNALSSMYNSAQGFPK